MEATPSAPSPFAALLSECRRRFGPHARRLGFLDRVGYLNTRRPGWRRESDRLSRFFHGRWRLLEEGQVVWGHLIQANILLFEPGPHGCPGEGLCCTDSGSDADPSRLRPVAPSVAGLKKTSPGDAACCEIADYLTNERIRVFGLPVPAALCEGMSCAISTLFSDRRRLPNRIHSLPHFPLVAGGGPEPLAMVLPSRYWSEALVRLWTTCR